MKNRKDNTAPPLAQRNARTGWIVFGAVCIMLGLSFAAVPFYSIFCRLTGFGGTPQNAISYPTSISDRVIKVQFNADIDNGLGWDFSPEQREIKVNLGQKGLASYRARNETSEILTGIAVYNVTPLKAGKYFNKVECFCFGEQILEPHQEVHMPVMFFIDPAMEKDPDMEDVTVITLSYTFYRAESKALDRAMEAFYNQ